MFLKNNADTQLLKEMQKGNELTAELLKEKKLDDTAKQLLAGNIFEILNARNLFSKQNELLTTGQTKEEDADKKEVEQSKSNAQFIARNLNNG